MERIRLFNRDGADLFLVNNDDERYWHFEVDDNHKYVIEFMRVGYLEDYKTIDFVDPSGGPMIYVGSRFDNYVIDRIIECNKLVLRHTHKYYF